MQLRIWLNDFVSKKYFYPIIFAIFTVFSFLPPITQKPFAPEDTQLVIIELLKVALKPFVTFGFLFHLATIILAGWLLINPKATARPVFWYMGIDFIRRVSLDNK